MLQPVPLADPAAEIAAWWRLVELCLPSHEGCGAVTFAPSGHETLEADWDRWLTGIFIPVLHPALTALQPAAVTQDAARVLSEDAALGGALPADAARGSLTAGRHLLLSFQPPQAAKLLERLRVTAATDPSVGQLTTVFAVRAQTFHLPFRQVAGALLLAECVLGADAAGVTLPAPRTIDLLQRALDRMAALPSGQLLAV
ncbi:MAG: hypothetical protein WEC73_02185 [Chthoniobacterales bacterium]